MADVSSVEAYLEGKNPDGVALFRRFEAIVESCGPSVAAPRSSIVYWKRRGRSSAPSSTAAGWS